MTMLVNGAKAGSLMTPDSRNRLQHNQTMTAAANVAWGPFLARSNDLFMPSAITSTKAASPM